MTFFSLILKLLACKVAARNAALNGFESSLQLRHADPTSVFNFKRKQQFQLNSISEEFKPSKLYFTLCSSDVVMNKIEISYYCKYTVYI